MRQRLSFIGELLFLVVVLVVAMTAALVLISGINPLETPAMMVLMAVAAIVVGAHHVWYGRRRDEIEHGRERLAARERRGF